MSDAPPMAAVAPPRRPRRWRRWAWRLALGLVAGRLLLAVFLPQLLGLVATLLGLELTMRSATVSLTGLSLRIEDFVLRDAGDPDAPPLARGHELEFDASLRELLSGSFVVVDAAAASVRVRLQRDAEGTFRLPRAWTSAPPVGATTTTTTDAAATAAAVDFTPPLRIVSARLHDVQVDIDTLQPGRNETFTIDADVRDLGSPTEPGVVVARVHAPERWDTAWFEAKVRTAARQLHVDWQFQVRGTRHHDVQLPQPVVALLGDEDSWHLSLRGAATGEVRADNAGTARYSASLRGTIEGGGREQLGFVAAIGPSAPGAAGTTWPFVFDVAARDTVQRLRVDGDVHRDDAETTVHGRLQLERATLARLSPWLQEAGIRLPGAGWSARGTLEAVVGATLDCTLRDFGSEDGSVRLPLLRLQDVRRDGTALAIGELSVTGPELTLTRRGDGAIEFGGVQVGGSAATAAAAAATTSPPAGNDAWPIVRLGRLRWSGLQLRCTDASLPGEPTLALDDLELYGDALTFGCDAPPGHLTATFRLADAAEAVHSEATVSPGAEGVSLAWQLSGEGLTGRALAPWLAPLGVATELQQGSLQAKGHVELRRAPARIDARIADLVLRDGDRELLRCDELVAAAAADADGVLQPLTVRLTAPTLAVRHAGDAFHLLGLRFTPPPADAAAPTAAAAAPQSRRSLPPLPDCSVQDARITYDDGAGAPLQLRTSASLGPAADGAHPFTVNAAVDGMIETLAVQGRLVRFGPAVAATLQLDGIQGVALQRLLPAPVSCTLGPGRAAATLFASRTPAGEMSLQVIDLRVRDGETELLGLDAAELTVARPDAATLHVGSLTTAGLRARVVLDDDGIAIAGMHLAAAAPEAAPTGPPAAVPAAPLQIPAMAVGRVALAIERLELTDRRGGGAGTPLVVQGTLTMPAWNGMPDADEPPPAQLQLVASAVPLCRELRADITLAPYEPAPTLAATLRATGLDTTVLPQVLPKLAGQVTGTLADGELTATVHASIDPRRRDVRTFDPTRPFGAELRCDDVVLRDRTSGEVLAAFGALDIVARTIDPVRGDVLLRTITLDDPLFQASRDANGLTLPGLRLTPAVAAPDAATPPPVPTPPAAPVAATPEFAVDEVEVRGLRATWRDLTTDPPTHLPIVDGELELLRASSRAWTEPRRMAFQASVRGGDVTLEKRVIASSMFAGLIGSAAAALTGGADQHTMEQRPVFDEAVFAGELQFTPQLRGTVRGAVGAFELSALRGLAKGAGVDIADGVLDQSIAVDLRGNEGIDVRSNHVFTWLSLSEPPGGPISTYLRLPAPLDSVLFLLRNDADEHRLPIAMHLPARGLSGREVSGLVAEAVARIVADAFTSAAGRAAGTLTGALGLGGAAAATVQAALPFAAGDPLPGPADLGPLAAALAADPDLEVVLTHALGEGDLARAEALGTPDAEAIAATAHELRRRRDGLTADRPPLVAAVIALHAAGQLAEAQRAQARLSDHDDRLGAIERTLGRTLDMLANDSPRAQHRRTAAAAKALGGARLDAAVAALRRQLPDLAIERIVRRPVRTVVAEGLPAGGAIALTTRRRTAR